MVLLGLCGPPVALVLVLSMGRLGGLITEMFGVGSHVGFVVLVVCSINVSVLGMAALLFRLIEANAARRKK